MCVETLQFHLDINEDIYREVGTTMLGLTGL